MNYAEQRYVFWIWIWSIKSFQSFWCNFQILTHYQLLTIDFILPGAHTIGKAHCVSFANRLSPLDPRMSKKLVKNLLQVFPTVESRNKTALDRKSPEKFDRKYYKNLMKKWRPFNFRWRSVLRCADQRAREAFQGFRVRVLPAICHVCHENEPVGCCRMGKLFWSTLAGGICRIIRQMSRCSLSPIIFFINAHAVSLSFSFQIHKCTSSIFIFTTTSPLGSTTSIRCCCHPDRIEAETAPMLKSRVSTGVLTPFGGFSPCESYFGSF